MKKLRHMDQELGGTACVITGGLLETIHAKTAHGLVRESSRFEVLGIIDDKLAGQDAGDIIEGKPKNIPVVASIDDLIKKIGQKPEYAVIGMATKGGVLPESLYPLVKDALERGIHIVNGLHQPLSSVEELQRVAEKSSATIYDIRKPRTFDELHFWKGDILEVDCVKMGILGTDCSMGKRTTAAMLKKALNEAGIKAEMIFTGQTGWLQGLKYGFIFDATPNDFIPGEIEHAIYSCWKNEKPDVIIVEGQASLLNPGGPCGSEFIISGRLDGVVLQHHPVRERYNNLERIPINIHDFMIDKQIIELMGVPVWAMTLNTSKMSAEQIAESKTEVGERSELPVVCPREEGVAELVEIVKSKKSKKLVKA